MPHNILGLSFDFRVVFVANLSDQTEIILKHAHDNVFDWLHKYDDKTIRAFCSFNRTHNKYYYEEAKKYNLSVVTIGDDFQQSIAEAVTVLAC